MDPRYKSFLKEICAFVDKKRIYTDDLRLLAWGTDAGFYRLIPKIVIRSKDETEACKGSVSGVGTLKISGDCNTGTFSVSGTGTLDASKMKGMSISKSVSGVGEIK